jgi:hypothetical protein
MKIQWIPILGAAAALVAVKITGHYFGTTAAVVAVCVLLLCWFGAHLIYKQQLVKIRAHLASLDDKGRADLLSRASPEIRKDLEQLSAKNEKTA